MEYSVREISNAVMIDSLDSIIQQESLKLEMDKNTGLIAKKSKLINVIYNQILNYLLYFI